MTTLLLVETDDGIVAESATRALSAARALDGEVHALIAGAPAQAAVAMAQFEEVAQVLHAEGPLLEQQLAEPLAALVVSLAPAYDAIVAAATASGKTVMPRIAALLDVMQVSDVIRVLAPDTFERPIYAGNAIETVQSGTRMRVLTVRAAAFPPAVSASASAPVVRVEMPPMQLRSERIGIDLRQSDRPELTAARIVVSGGRALQSAETFRKTLEPLAEKLKAAIGASRAAVDAGYAPNDLQVGQTGKIVAPELYIAIGISGAIQHLAGMKDARVIVAINKDPDAPIFTIADYGIVGDLHEVVPELTRLL